MFHVMLDNAQSADKKWHRFLGSVLWFMLLRLVTRRSLSACTDHLHITMYIFSVFICLCNS